MRFSAQFEFECSEAETARAMRLNDGGADGIDGMLGGLIGGALVSSLFGHAGAPGPHAPQYAADDDGEGDDGGDAGAGVRGGR